MHSITDKPQAKGYRAVIRPIALAVLTFFSTIEAFPTLRASFEGGITKQSYSGTTVLEPNSALALQISRFPVCPYRISAGVRVLSVLKVNSSYYTIAPEVNAYYIKPIIKNLSISGGIGAGYLLSPFAEIESGLYGRLHATAIYSPLPIIELSLALNSMPFKTPIDENFSNFGAAFGITYLFGFKDEDRDWVADDRDTCPNTPRGAKVNDVGCAFDSDGDGVFDGLDKCPNTPSGCIVEKDGCPVDSDGDGICDGVDICPETPGHIVVDSTGCPKDTDGDGVPDYLDKCPGTPRKAIVDEFGCPKDSDEDGVPDGIDQCPQTPSGFIVNSVGCPFVSPIEHEEIRDAYDVSLGIKASAMQKLENISERLRAYPFRIVEIGVYTDSEGSVTYNINRGMRVAEKVRDVLVARGVAPEQLRLKGYGEADPVAPNSTAEGLIQNRRIVFKYAGDK